MDRSRIEIFAKEARKVLKAQIAARVELLRKSDSTSIVIENKVAMNALEKKITEKGLDTVVDEVSYTWFNRLCALRYMDAHGFNRPLVVTPLEGNVLPEILSDAMTGNPDTDILSKSNEERINKLLTGEVRSSNAQAEIYRILLVSKCNALNKDIPMLFERISDYTDLLLPDDLLSRDAIIPMMREALTDENCETVEVIGWLYQYYISERKNEVFADFKKGKKATAKEIPAATQLFTPEWIVRYLVENSLGRLWLLNHPESKLVDKMKYYIKPVDVEPDYIKISSPEEIKICDPCCGSGHMLTYSFDILFEIYSELGYTPKDAAEHIIRENLYGIELDDRAGQLAYFALMMKAREKSRRFFSTGVQPNICVLHNVSFSEEDMAEATGLFNHTNDLLITKLLAQYEHADTLGSLITPFVSDIDELKGMLTTETTGDFFSSSNNTVLPRVKDVLKYSEYLSKRYHIVITNPPYLDPSSSDAILHEFAKKEYPNSKSDTGTMFIERNHDMVVSSGYVAMVTLQSWMFLPSFEKLRKRVTTKKTILSMAHIGTRGFDAIDGEIVSTCACILASNYMEGYKGQYVRLVDGDSEDSKIRLLETAIVNHDCEYFHEVSSEQFEKVPGSLIAYWINNVVADNFVNKPKFGTFYEPRQGLATGNDDLFLRLWHEINISLFSASSNTKEDVWNSQKKYVPFNKGGSYRKWYGNNNYVIFFDLRSYERLSHQGNNLPSKQFYFHEGVTWSALTSGMFSGRYCGNGFVFAGKGPMCFANKPADTIGMCALMNSKPFSFLYRVLAGTMDFNQGTMRNLPYVSTTEEAESLARNSIIISKMDWDSFETSWDFKRSPLLDPLTEPTYEEQVEMDAVTFKVMKYLGELADDIFYITSLKCSPLEGAYRKYKDQVNEDFYHLKMNEEELNRIFIDIYGLQDELEPEEDESMVSIHRIYDSAEDIPDVMKKSRYALTKKDVIEDFISYAVGCMFGRYSLDVEGLAYAGGEWDSSKYSSFIPDEDNVIPVLSGEWFKDDIVFRFRDFVKVTFGEDSLAENMRFIEDSLGMTIRNYFVKGFYNHHLSTYKNRPIYWMFSSPKGYFNALVYLHRYNENTATTVLGYLRQLRSKLATEISALERENNSRNAKTLVNYRKMAEDLDAYERILFPIAMENISLDLDDGVKVNYAKLGKALKKVSKLEKSDE